MDGHRADRPDHCALVFRLVPDEPAAPALVAVGAVRDTALVAALTVPVVVAVQIIASFYGLTAVAWSFFIANAYSVLVSMHIVRRHIALPWSELLHAMRKSALVAVASAVPPLLAVMFEGGANHVSNAGGVVAAVMSAAAWLLAIQWLGHPIKNEIARALEAVGRAIIPPFTLQNLKSVKDAISLRVFDGRKSSGYDPRV